MVFGGFYVREWTAIARKLVYLIAACLRIPANDGPGGAHLNETAGGSPKTPQIAPLPKELAVYVELSPVGKSSGPGLRSSRV